MTVKEFDRRLKLLIAQINSKDFLSSVAIEAIRLIRARVKSGSGVIDDSQVPAKKTKLKPLSKKYVEKRKKISLGKLGLPGRSNLTLTGQMLNNIEYKIDEGIRIFIKDNSRSDSKLTNAEVAFFASFDRPFLALTEQEYKRIVSLYERRVRQLIRIYFK